MSSPPSGSARGASEPSPRERLGAAFRRNDAMEVRRLFERHPELRAEVDAPSHAFNSPAIVAFANDAAMVAVLLEFGADPNRRSEWWAGGFHALYSATGEAAERLLAAGAIPDACAAAHLDRPDLLATMLADDPARVHERGGDGQTPLHFARSRAVVDLLLAAGADIDARDVDHRSTAAEWMLGQARGSGRYDLAEYLISRGATPDIFLATALGLTERARMMVEAHPGLLDARIGEGAYAEQPPGSYPITFWTIGSGRSPLDVAAQFGHETTIAALLPFASPVQRLCLACQREDGTAARALVREHPGLIASFTPHDHRSITNAAWQGAAGAVALMLELGFDPRTAGHDAGTALHCAAWQGSRETVEAILRHPDANELIWIRDSHHNATPLGWCFHGSQFGDASHDHAGVARLLLAAGARPDPGNEASPAVEAVIAEWER